MASSAARIGSPGTTTRRPASRPLTPAWAACSAVTQAGRGTALSNDWPPPTSQPATFQNSVETGPGASAVTVTPEPRNSWCRASEKVRT